MIYCSLLLEIASFLFSFIQVRNHKCNSCEKAFTQAGALRTHIALVHEGIKDHQCEKCSKAFASANDLKRHINDVHEGIKSHQCELCKKCFSRAGNLRYLLSIINRHKLIRFSKKQFNNSAFQYETVNIYFLKVFIKKCLK